MCPAPEESFEAARGNDRDRVERLLEHGTDLRARRRGAHPPPLDHAVQRGHAAGTGRLRARSEKLGGGTSHA